MDLIKLSPEPQIIFSILSFTKTETLINRARKAHKQKKEVIMKKNILLIVTGVFAVSATSFATPTNLELNRIQCTSHEDQDYAPLHIDFSRGLFTSYLHLSTTIGDDSSMALLTTPVSSEVKGNLIVITSDDGKVTIKVPTTVKKATSGKGVTADAVIKDVGNIERYTFKCIYNTAKVGN